MKYFFQLQGHEGVLIKLILALLITIIIGMYMRTPMGSDSIYIAGRYGSKCYNQGNEHGNIKYPIRFPSLEECLKYIKK